MGKPQARMRPMSHVGRGVLPIDVLLTLVVGYTAAILFFLARGLKARSRRAVLILLGIIVLGSAVLLRTDIEAIRCVVALLLVIYLLHMWDLHLDPCRDSRLRLKDYMVSLLDYAWSVARTPGGYGLDLSARQRALDTARCVVGLGLVSVVTVGVFRIDWSAHSFLLEHSAKSTSLGAWTAWAFHANTAIWRLARAPAALFTSRSVLWAYNPADFWRRWNRPMQRWLLENVYRPSGGRRNPRVAVLVAFAVSGLFHEYLFAVTFRCVTGCVMAFFLLHGLAAMVTRRFKPAGWLVLPAIVATCAFNTISTVLLSIPINERVSFYVNNVPRWLNPW